MQRSSTPIYWYIYWKICDRLRTEMVCHGISQPSPSAYSARSNLGSTVSCDITERDSPTLSQTLRGQWVKRARLGTRLRISDTRLTTLRLRVRLGRCFVELHHGGVSEGCYRFSGLPVVHVIARKILWQKATSEFQEPSLSNWGQVHSLSCENEFCLNENEKSFPY